MKRNTRTNQNPRRGVTLLFTISMIVLFLLMGTTFVVVANDYFKTAKRRSGLNSFKIDATALLDRAFYDVVRGPALDDVNSPLRGQSILEDQYGYGLTSPLSSALNGPTNALKVLVIDDPFNVSNPLLTNIRGDGTTTLPATAYRNGIFNGRVITVTSGASGAYYSTRIISHFLDTGSSPSRLLITIPTDDIGITWTGTDSIASLAMDGNIRIVINGRDFSGFGAGDVTGLPGSVLPTGMQPDFAYSGGNPTALLGANSLRPNRIGESLAALIANGGYLESDNSPNEPYDIPNEQNMYLSGTWIAGGAATGASLYRPSFHDDRLYNDQVNAGSNLSVLRQSTFRSVYRANGANPADGSTADGPFSGTSNNGTFTGTANQQSNCDVDTNGDGDLDAVWIDIGLPVQTDAQGRQFRPMVAYRIVDMDGRLNLNAHGGYADQQILAGGGTATRRGSSYGVADISLRNLLGTDAVYLNLLNARSDVTESPARPGNINNELGIQQNLFGHPDSTINTGGLFSTGSDIFGRGVVQRSITGVLGDDALPEFVSGPALAGSAQISAYAADFSIGGGVGDNLYRASELEPLLRSSDVDNALIDSRLRALGINANVNSITTDSFEIAMPPVAVLGLLAEKVAAADFDAFIQSGYLSNEVLMGGLFDLNQLTGNGVDENGDGIIDDPIELNNVAQVSPRQDGLTFDLDNNGDDETGDGLARQRKATQLYTLAMLVTGDAPPAYLTSGTGSMTTAEYRQAVAQWAINVVDFSDADSICTIFEYDTNPFNNSFVDGNPTTTAEADRAIVFGCERPEIIFNEVLTFHDRRNQDLAADSGENGKTTDDDGDGDPDDDDWDSGYLPETGTYIELLNPNSQTDTVNDNAATGFQRNAAELYGIDNGIQGVDLGATSPIDDAPVWRIGVKRADDETEPFVRGIFFADPTAGPAGVTFPSDNFYPSDNSLKLVQPGNYFVLGSLGNVPTQQMSTFGRPTSNMEDVANTRSIRLDDTIPAVVVKEWDGAAFTENSFDAGVAIIDSPRSLSLSDPNGGYASKITDPAIMTMVKTDGTELDPARDRPLDADADAADINAIWTNGVTEAFRYVYLQRLADPTQGYDATTNPYLTVDKAKVDLLAFNGLHNDPDNDGSVATGNKERYDTDPTPGVQMTIDVIDGFTEFRTIERGELAAKTNVAIARRNWLRTEPGVRITADLAGGTVSDGMNFSYELDHTFGTRNDAHSGTNSMTEPVGWLVWNNRPFANAMELFHVPFSNSEDLLNRVNFSRIGEDVMALDAMSEPEDVFAYYMSDDKFGHLLGYGGMSPAAGGGASTGSNEVRPTRRNATFANRFDYIFDFVDVPSRFLGSKTFLPTEAVANPASNGLMFNMYAPYNTIPNFREPGKVNANTIWNSTIYEALRGGFGGNDAVDYDYAAFFADRNISTGGSSNFEGVFTSATHAQFVNPNMTPHANGGAGLFRRDAMTPATRVFDFQPETAPAAAATAAATDSGVSSWFENEFRQRLDSTTTTRSSVFSIWITIGYFEVDQYGRVGAELGSDEGLTRRDRAFYMVDRSIPVACEPGKNHNVDDAVLVRTIIE